MQIRIELTELLNLQNQLNVKMAGEDWITNPEIRPYRAAWVECAELMDWLDYKWWKNQEVNHKEVLIELTDIAHFLFSMALLECVTGSFVATIETENPLESVETLASSLLTKGDFVSNFSKFINLVYSCGFNWSQVENLYHGKYALNKLRQDMGDKEGTYSREWNGVEDNVVMYDIATSGNIAPSRMYDALRSEYLTVK